MMLKTKRMLVLSLFSIFASGVNQAQDPDLVKLTGSYAVQMDYSDLISRGNDFDIQERRVEVSPGVKDYNFEREEDSKIHVYQKGESNNRDYFLRVEKDTPSSTGRVQRITEVSEQAITFGEGFGTAFGINYGPKGTRAITASFDNNGHLISRTFCDVSRSSLPSSYKGKCRTISYNRCVKALELNKRMDEIKVKAEQCKSLGEELNAVYNDANDLKLVKENLAHLSEHSRVRKLHQGQDLPKPAKLSEVEYRLPDLGYTIRMCEEYGKYFKHEVAPAQQEQSSQQATSENAE